MEVKEYLDYEGLSLFSQLTKEELAKKQNLITSFSIEKIEDKEYIVLKSGENVLGAIDTTKFVYDGMLKSASLVTTAEGYEGEPEVPYIKLVFNAEGGDRVVAFSVKELVDIYTEGDGIKIKDNQISIDTAVVSQVGHGHEIEDVEGLQTELDSKVNKKDLKPITAEQIYALFGKKVKTVDTPEALVDAIAQGGNVCLTSDVKIDSSVTIAADNVDVNLNGKTLEVGGNWGIKVTGQNAKISNGTIEINEHSSSDVNDRAVRVEGGSAKIDNVTFKSELNTFVAVQGTKNVGGSVEIIDCVVDAPNIEAFAITQNGTYGGTTWVIKDTVVNAPNCNAAVYISNNKNSEKQNVVIDGCEINAKGCLEVKHTNLTVKNSTFAATDEQTYVENGNGNCTTGYDIAVTKNAKDTEISGELVLSGNTYSCVEGGKYVYLHATEVPEGYVLDTDSIKFKA